MAAKNDTKATHEKRTKFLALLAETGNVARSARLAKLNRPALYDYYDKNPEFADLWDKCAKLGGYALKDEARRRAVEGVLKPVFYKGKKCGTVREYSDTLLIVLLKAAFPEEFAERRKDEVAGKDGGPVIFRWAKPEETANDG